MQTISEQRPLEAFSLDLARAVEAAEKVVVAVNGRPRTPSSGVHWRAGVVVTTDHTLKRDEQVTITLAAGATLPATIAGRDPATDLAVLRVPELDAPSSVFAQEAPRAGHAVLAIGRGPTASFGIVSGTGPAWRTWRGGSLDQLIRPGLAIYTGFSGGALVDAQGRILGINTSGLTRGSGITVPVSTVNRVTDEILSRGHVAKGYLGVALQPVRLPEPLQSQLQLAGSLGLIALTVEPGSPAAQAGMFLGDIVTGLNGVPLTGSTDLQHVLGGENIGQTIQLQVIRGGQRQEVNVVIGERPARS